MVEKIPHLQSYGEDTPEEVIKKAFLLVWRFIGRPRSFSNEQISILILEEEQDMQKKGGTTRVTRIFFYYWRSQKVWQMKEGDPNNRI